MQHPTNGALTASEYLARKLLSMFCVELDAFAEKGLSMLNRRQTTLAALSLAAMSACAPVHAATCAQRQAILDRLTQTYGETVQSMGLGSNNGIVEVFASPETGTWTITVTMPNGMTCLVASGQAYEA